MLESSSMGCEHGAESEDAVRFLKSLQELRQLRSQIHYAADYCEAAFLKAKDKKEMLDNTKEYICRAVVTVVDHVGTVSTNLDSQLKNNDRVAETELRIDSLRQKLLSSELYNQNRTFTRKHWSVASPRHYPRYILPPIKEFRGSKGKVESEDEVPLFMCTSTQKISMSEMPMLPEDDGKKNAPLASVLPSSDGLCMSSKSRSQPFHFQNPQKHGRQLLPWKSMSGNKVRILVRQRSKKETSKLFRFTV